MSTGNFPNDYSRRRAIAVLEEHDIENCSRKGETQILTDSQMHVLSYPVTRESTNKALINILDAGLHRPGTILIQSPFDPDHYEDAAEANQRFALEKHTIFSNFCQLLGAKKVSVTQMDIVTNEGMTSLVVDGQRLVAKGEFKLENFMNDSLCSQLSLVDEYTGGVSKPVEAEDLMRSRRLAGDPNMRSLLQARRAGGNDLTRRTLTVNLSTEANNNWKVATRLDLPVFAFGVDYKKALKEKKEYRMSVEVLF